MMKRKDRQNEMSDEERLIEMRKYTDRAFILSVAAFVLAFLSFMMSLA